ncbi:serine/threonine-protein kinase [Variovorax ginsengisoli]|uniref:Serine/threonine-protein kinase n=1 Tax=Variovorax ginsengisoli TaxID=363844 RepID=A0ABT9SC85_9BURK|nr:serine/threonine-protein kinase [Variovorax ginsengisoli]MDP9901022.1 serine/threonine-protein kinase [Variovorax ginsengisoli]
MAVPERIGKYTISEVLGRGAMGVVYKGFDPHIHRPVAIKVIHKELLGDNEAQDSIAARFRNEAQAVGRIAHPGVVAIYEFGEDDSAAYIAMEFVLGRNLDEVLAGTPLLDEAQVVRIMEQLLGALAVAHAHGVWHRDIKPANLILTASGQVKLTDFGIARIEHAGLTQVSSMIGTPGYMAPEQYMGEGVDHRADLFACGVLLYRLLTGRPAFSGSAEVIMYKILNEHPPAPSVVSEGRRPAAYDAIVARAMAKLPAQRFTSAQEMRQALLHIASGAGAAVAPPAGGSDATVIVAPGQWAGAVDVAARATPPARPPSAVTAASTSMRTAAVPTGWDPQELSRIERALASHIGPMARLMVRQAAGSCNDVVSLATAVSVHILESGRRQAFMSTATAGSQAQPLGSALGAAPSQARPTGGATQLPGTLAPTPMAAVLSEDFRARALQVMVRHLGPIARVVVKRAGDQCLGDRNRFVQLLVEAAAEGDRAGLQRELAALA